MTVESLCEPHGGESPSAPPRFWNGHAVSCSLGSSSERTTWSGLPGLEAGITYANAPTIGAEVQSPFGGTEETGPTDTREVGTTALEEFTYWKTVYVDYSGRLQKAQIDTAKLVGD